MRTDKVQYPELRWRETQSGNPMVMYGAHVALVSTDEAIDRA